MKRLRDDDDDDQPRARSLAKRPKVNPDLVRVWERLADDSEDTRLEAAYELISNHFALADSETAQKLLGRLFRGLCSGRKSARPGFYTALTTILSPQQKYASNLGFTPPMVLQLLEAHTTADDETFKQDERDHYYGKLLGLKAIIDSGLLRNAVGASWAKVSELIFETMVKKPWLRAEASVIIVSCIQDAGHKTNENAQNVIIHLLGQLKQYKLAKTIHGLSVWLKAMEYVDPSKLPAGVWKAGNPLNTAELQTLRRTLLDKQQAGQAKDDDEELAGTSGWAPRLNFAWHDVLERILLKSEQGEILFEDFWREVVEKGLFEPSSEPERKLLGFLVFETAVKMAKSPDQISLCFSKNLMATMIQALRTAEEAYLSKVIHTTFNNVLSHYGSVRNDDLGYLVQGFLQGSNFADFDSLTRTKFVQSLFQRTHLVAGAGITQQIIDWLRKVPATIPKASQSVARRNILTIFHRALDAKIHEMKAVDLAENANQRDDLFEIRKIMFTLIAYKKFAKLKSQHLFDDDTRTLLSEKLTSLLESLLTLGQHGRKIFFDLVAIYRDEKLDADENIQEDIESCWIFFSDFQIHIVSQDNQNKKETKGTEVITPEAALALIFGLNLWEIYDGNTEAVEMLEELGEIGLEWQSGGRATVANNVVDTLMGLISRPSKLNRRVGNLAFSGLAALVSSDGLKTLTDVITTKETREGQQALFEHDGDLEDEVDDTDSSNDEELDSDVEVIEGSDLKLGAEDEDDDDSSQSSSDSEEEDDDAELNSFESALAAALGTRKFTEADLNDAASASSASSTESDSDMSDSEMMQLDSKLAEVFRNQANQASAQKQRKEEVKNAKENVINLKNRAMDLIEIFLRTQQSRGIECVELLAALLVMAKETGTPQLSSRALDMVKNYVQRCKGAKLPVVAKDHDDQKLNKEKLGLLYGLVHDKDASNAFIDVAAQLHILLCKFLGRAGQKDVAGTVEKLSGLYGSRNEVRRKALLDFWSRFDAWLTDAEKKEKAGKEEVSSSRGKATSATEPARIGSKKKKKSSR